MKILNRKMSAQTILNKIQQRRQQFAERVIIPENICPEDKAFLETYRNNLGRMAAKLGVTLQAKPIESNLFADSAVQVYKSGKSSFDCSVKDCDKTVEILKSSNDMERLTILRQDIKRAFSDYIRNVLH